VTVVFASRRTLVWLLVLIVAVPGLALAARRARLIGRVIDPWGQPVQGVLVTATSPQIAGFREARTTDKRGSFTIDFTAINVTYRYRFELAGYQTLEVEQEWRLEGTQRDEWTLTPAVPSAAGGVPAATTSEPAVLAFNAGVNAVRAKDYATAEAKLKEAVRHDPNLVLAWVLLSTVQVQTGHNQEAAEAAEKAMALGSRDEVVLQARWQAYHNLENETKAAEALKDLEAVGRRGEEATKLHNEAVALAKAGDHAGAFAKFQEALAVDPTLQASLLGLATAGLKIGKSAEAAAAAETILEMDPKNEAAIRIRYNACLLVGDKVRLANALVGLAAVEPAVAGNGLLKLAFEAYDANDKVQAKDRFLKVLQVVPNQPLAHYYLALLCINAGATAEAKSYLERFLALTPAGPEAASARDMLRQLEKVKEH
jgi:Tfp pilus assembly protein PilF